MRYAGLPGLLDHLAQQLPLRRRQVPPEVVIRRQAADVALAQDPGARLTHVPRLDEVARERLELPLVPVEELVPDQPAVEPQRLAHEVEVEELRRAHPVAGKEGGPSAGAGRLELETRLGRVVGCRPVGELGLVLLYVGVDLGHAHGAGVALVEDVVGVADELPAQPERLLVACVLVSIRYDVEWNVKPAKSM